MDVEAKRPPMSEVWTQLEGRVVNGSFPLHRCLGSSDHSGVFLTEYAPQNLPRAALKLASDTIHPAGEATASIGSLSMYNPPEARDGSFSTSGDIWALGVTLCQALTQRPPSRSGERGEIVVLPTDFPVTFIDIVRR